MGSDKTPSWRPKDHADSIEAARGTIRESLSALRNLEQLLRSLRVGPRALVSMIPDVVASCEPLTSAFHELSDAIVAGLPPARTALLRLEQETSPGIEPLCSELSGFAARPMNARNRLLLQGLVEEQAGMLQSASDLFGLLGSALWSRRVPISVREVVGDVCRGTEPVSGVAEGVRVSVEASIADVEVLCSPSSLASFLVHAVRWMIRLDPDCVPHVCINREHGCSPALIVGPPAQLGEPRWVVGRRTLGAVSECLKAAGQALGLDVTLETQPNRLTLLLSYRDTSPEEPRA